MRRIAGIIIAGMLAFAGVAMAAPAFASCPGDSGCVTATVTVPQSVTMAGLSTSVDFGSTPGGVPITRTGAENYTVTTNDSAGYTLQVTPGIDHCGSEGFTAQDNQCFQLNGSLSITETSGHGTSIGSGDWPSGVVGSPVAQTIATTASQNVVGPDSYSENWTLTVPENQEGGNYSETFDYVGIGN